MQSKKNELRWTLFIFGMVLVNFPMLNVFNTKVLVLDFYLATSGESEISQIHVSGGTAYLAPLCKAIEKRARVPVTVFDPMSQLTVDPKFVNEAEMRHRSAQMVVALGLALRCDKERRA